MNLLDSSLSLAKPEARINWRQKLSYALWVIGMGILSLAVFGVDFPHPGWSATLAIGLMTLGVGIYIQDAYANKPAGIHNHHNWNYSLTNRGIWGWGFGVLLTGFYCLLYWWPQYLGLSGGADEANTGLVALFDPLSQFFKKQDASQWFVYGTLYTVAIFLMGFKFLYKYRHNRYQILRTLSVMFFQLGFAYLIPEFLMRLGQPYNDFKNMWPLNYYFFDGWSLDGMLNAGNLGLFMLFWGFAMMFLISPFLTYKYGKRWYCSWVCGCGGLAETAGDPFRHLSDKSLAAWKVERWMIHIVLLLVTVSSLAVLYSYVYDQQGKILVSPTLFLLVLTLAALGIWGIIRLNRDSLDALDKRILRAVYTILGVLLLFGLVALLTGSRNMFFIDSYAFRKWYGFLVGSAFAGVVGVGFYPILGSRVWCRFGCPMAALLGLQQKYFSRFRITTNGGQCISCGNCSTYCEMGIDVRAYAQRGQDILRASCVGCGVCSAVCPRGVLRLENASGDISQRAKTVRNIHLGD